MSGFRIELDGSNLERKGQQFVSGRGVYNDAFTRIHRIEPHGFASSPIKGAKALLFSPNGDPDQAYVIGGEHPSHRPVGLPGGAVALYDANGNIIKLIGDEAIFDFGSRTATFTAGHWTISGDVTIKGNVTIIGNLNATGSITDGDGDGGA